MGYEFMGTSFEVVGAVYRAPQLLEGGEKAKLVLAGEFGRTLASGETVSEVFFQPCVTQGRLAGRLGTLPKGTALHMRGRLVKESQFCLDVKDAVRLPNDVNRLKLDRTDGTRLLEGYSLLSLLITAGV